MPDSLKSNPSGIKPATNPNSIGALTQEQKSRKFSLDIPSVSLPRGGGAIRSIDDKFQVNPSTGTATLSVPLPVTQGRQGMQPTLSLNYNSGSGNGPFGLGWSLDLPAIQVKSDKKIPQYPDTGKYMITGMEDLVPCLEETSAGKWHPKSETNSGLTIHRYRPRIDQNHHRIEKIEHPSKGVYWKVTTPGNVATFYGVSPSARLSNPGNDAQIYRWFPEFTYDDRGNWMAYEYKKEDPANVPDTSYNKNRLNPDASFTNVYLKSIKYGNRSAFYPDPTAPYELPMPSDPEHFFEMVWDYGAHDQANPLPAETPGQTWIYRSDAFSNYRAGFEIRTQRLCRRILMFHHFPDEAGTGRDLLVRSLDFTYQDSNVNESGQAEVTYLSEVIESGYIKKSDGSYTKKSLPPLSFQYQELKWNKDIRTITQESNPGISAVTREDIQWVDLYGEGISGMLIEQNETLFYKSNTGPGPEGQPDFSPMKPVTTAPVFHGLHSGKISLRDLEGNGEKQLVIRQNGVHGFHHLKDTNWENFVPFDHYPELDMNDDALRSIDLDGDGRTELVISHQDIFLYYPSLGKKGFSKPYRTTKPWDEEQGPAVVFSGKDQRIFLADMSGDGLTDIVRITNGEVSYWANMGYGRFSAKITMSESPVFDHPDQFDSGQLLLADISGTGTTDIIYLGRSGIRAYLNLSGNSWSFGHVIDPFFPVNSQTGVDLIDLMGNGTSCLVWSSPLPEHALAPVRYMDLMDSRKPHLLTMVENNMGKVILIEYKSSTRDYLNDKKKGRPWMTRLPFPVQVVSRMTLEEKLSDVRFTTSYTYHHGYYDHEDKEFRGFGRVDQQDSEYYPEWSANSATNAMERSEVLFQKPVLTKTWYHTGALIDREKILTQFESEYWYRHYAEQFPADILSVAEPSLPDARLAASPLINDPAALDRLSAEEYREAFRSCKGLVLRQEVFALDAPPENPTLQEQQLQAKPYTVSAYNCHIQLLQPASVDDYAVFQVLESEALTIWYERDETDSRISHGLNISYDPYGNVLEKATVLYGRNGTKADTENQILRSRVTDFTGSAEQARLQTAFLTNIDAAKKAQTKTSIQFIQSGFSRYKSGNNEALIIDLPHAYRLRKLTDQKTFEISGMAPSGSLYTIQDFTNAVTTGTTAIEFHDIPDGSPQRRLIEHLKVLFFKDDLTGPLTQGNIESKALPYETYQLAYTADSLSQLFKDSTGNELKVNGKKIDTYLKDPGYFVEENGVWWMRSGISHLLDPQHSETVTEARKRFFLPIWYEDSSGEVVKVTYDTESFTSTGRHKNDGYYLFVQSTMDALNNRISIDQYDFRVMKPARLIDANANPSSVLFDELGRVKAVALEGNRYTDPAGSSQLDPADHLTGLTSEETPAELTDFNALVNAANTHEMKVRAANMLKGATTRFYYDLDAYRNSGKPVRVLTIDREEHSAGNPASNLQLRFSYLNGLGETIMTKTPTDPGIAHYMESGVLQSKNTFPDLRWIGTGRTIFNNKGNPVKQYEPYFSTNHHYEQDNELTLTGVTTILYYDALGRKVRSEMPNGTHSTTAFSPWRQTLSDPNDTVMTSQWYDDRRNRNIDTELTSLGIDPVQEQTAATQTEAHHDTPATLLLDPHGRPVLHVSHNGWDATMKELLYTTFIKMDIEGNALQVTDARGNPTMKYQYNLLGQRLVQTASDSGRRTTFLNAMENPVFQWDEKNHIHQFVYDPLQRVTEVKVTGGLAGNLDHTYQRIIYGEDVADDLKNNLRLQVYQIYDTAGKVTHRKFDFKGNILRMERLFTRDYKSVVNWVVSNPDNLLDTQQGPYTTSREFDALGRMRKVTSPDNTVSEYIFNPGNQLKQIFVTSPGQPRTEHIDDILYNEKGQQTSIVLGNGVRTDYRYDPYTFLLRKLTSRKGNGEPLQDLNYHYDPAGNITCIHDKCIPVQFFSGNRIDGQKTFKYDPLYRLIEAKGREHAGQQIPFATADNVHDLPFIKSYAPNDAMTWRTFTQKYDYDPVGNILNMDHRIDGSGHASHEWTRSYTYQTANNRLTNTRVGGQTFTTSHDQDHGYINSLPHLSVMDFNFKDELVRSARQVVNTGSPESTWYVYDGTGQRVRKITENANGTIREERIYTDDVEIYHKVSGTNAGLERSTFHVMDGEQRLALIETRNGIDDGSPAYVVRYQLSDQLGSSVMEVDGSARVISYEEYHPYGTSAYQATSSQIQVARRRYRYSGMERDEKTGMGYHTARYYIPWMGRWLSPDPVGIAAGLNLYAYVSGKVITHRDTYGKNEKPDRRLDVDRLLAERESNVAEWLRAYAVEKVSEKELKRKDPDPGETTEEYYRSSNTVILEHSGRKSSSKAPYHCTDYVMNTMFKSGLRPIAGGYGPKLDKGDWAAYYKPTKKVYAQMDNLEKLQLAEEVDIDPASPLANVKPGDIMVTAKGETWGHHVLIVGLDTAANKVITREAGVTVKSKRRTIDTSKWKVYRLIDVDPEEFKELYENNEEFRDFINEKYEAFEAEENEYIRRLNSGPVRPVAGETNEPYVYPEIDYWLPPPPPYIPPDPNIPGAAVPLP